MSIRCWKCEGCGQAVESKPWECPSCHKEVCELCFDRYMLCKECSYYKTDLEALLFSESCGIDWSDVKEDVIRENKENPPKRKFPPFVKLKHKGGVSTALVIGGDFSMSDFSGIKSHQCVYSRPAGEWGVVAEFVDDKLVCVGRKRDYTLHLDGMELVPCSKEACRKDNEPYGEHHFAVFHNGTIDIREESYNENAQ